MKPEEYNEIWIDEDWEIYVIFPDEGDYAGKLTRFVSEKNLTRGYPMCPMCGRGVGYLAQYCPRCGAKLEWGDR